jgi:glycosyltransferase involved in cell wall biosynthesis
MIEDQDKKPTLCIGILTLNEERRIAACIDNAAFADQIIVIDSGSTDRTCEIATEKGAEVHRYADWQGFAVQRNRLLEHVRTDYIFFLDADETIPAPLRQEIQQAVETRTEAVWKVFWEQVAFGTPLTRMTKVAGGVRRLFAMTNILRYEGVVHEHAILRNPDTPERAFKGRLLHHSRETVYGSLLKLAQYAQLGAVRRAQGGKTGGIWRGLASAFMNFVRFYFFRKGFLCGGPGFLFCLVVSLECFFRYAILKYDPMSENADVVKR